jgi:hypothetical protein
MTQKMFLNQLAQNGQFDIIQQLLDLVRELQIRYCLIGGLAVNAYVEPVVSLDVDMVIAAEQQDGLLRAVENMFTIKRFPHSLNLNHAASDVRIQFQNDPRYQAFLTKSTIKQVMGYDMAVAALEDVLQGKIWAYSDPQRRGSQRQKDLADILRLVEAYPELHALLPETIRRLL